MDLIRFYRALAQHPLEIYSKFCSLPREPETYYEIRSRWHSGSDEIARAAYFLYLNRNCYNGIFRTNLRGEFNVPFSACRVPPYPSFEEVKTAALELAKVTIRCEDFEEACRAEVRNRDFVYLDPPYYVPSVRIFREYSSKPFNEGDLQRLADLLNEIDRRGARFLLSYPDCRLIRGIARSWRSSRISVRRTISGKLASRGYAPELLIRNY
jgi:DNA adenine methylase